MHQDKDDHEKSQGDDFGTIYGNDTAEDGKNGKSRDEDEKLLALSQIFFAEKAMYCKTEYERK